MHHPGAFETLDTDDGRSLTVEHLLTKLRYRLGERVLYETDAGTLIDGVLVWAAEATPLYLPAGGRRRERTLVSAPRFVARELAAKLPIRVFYQRLGGLWAIERPGVAVVVRDARGEPLEVGALTGGDVGEPNTARPWSTLSEELWVGRVALWAQVRAKLAPHAEARAVAEQVRTAAFAVADLPHATRSAVRAHPALAGRTLPAPWARWLAPTLRVAAGRPRSTV